MLGFAWVKRQQETKNRPQWPVFFGSSRDPGKVEVDRQGAGKLVVAKHTTTITLLSPCIILILPP
ncbi:hypothetical protein, partial [Aeromonas caviae]|uniref:hypothetical protein n=1 Tax=Aeromonas caviae TaxID=648 RepID=UPI001C200888